MGLTAELVPVFIVQLDIMVLSSFISDAGD